MEQLAIAVFGVTAVWITQQKRIEWRKYACWFGMASQPFWFYATYTAQQWGIFILCCFYTYAWWLGIYNHWIAPHSPQEGEQ